MSAVFVILVLIGGSAFVVYLILRTAFFVSDSFLTGNYRKQVLQKGKAKVNYRHKHIQIKRILERHVNFYNELDIKKKKIFLERVIIFISHKKFTPKQGLELNLEHKVLISAAAIQLTFGYSLFLLPHFQRIYIFPKSFMSPSLNKKVLGLADTKGRLVLSYPDVKRGIEDAHDGYNLALHELAHALQISNDLQTEVDSHFSDYFPRWLIVADKTRKALQHTEVPFLRKYALSNMAEMFAVSVEFFFEKPREFEKVLPEFYYHTAILLRQYHFRSKEKLKLMQKVDGLYYSSVIPRRVFLASSSRISWALLIFFVLAIFAVNKYQDGEVASASFLAGIACLALAKSLLDWVYGRCQVLIFDDKIVLQYPKKLFRKYHQKIYFKTLVKAIFWENGSSIELWYLNDKYLIETTKIHSLGSDNAAIMNLMKRNAVAVEMVEA